MAAILSLCYVLILFTVNDSCIVVTVRKLNVSNLTLEILSNPVSS